MIDELTLLSTGIQSNQADPLYHIMAPPELKTSPFPDDVTLFVGDKGYMEAIPKLDAGIRSHIGREGIGRDKGEKSTIERVEHALPENDPISSALNSARASPQLDPSHKTNMAQKQPEVAFEKARLVLKSRVTG